MVKDRALGFDGNVVDARAGVTGGKGHCVASLAALTNVELRDRMEFRLSRDELAVVWYDVFKNSMADHFPDASKPLGIIELVERAHRNDLFNQLLSVLCKRHRAVSRPHVHIEQEHEEQVASLPSSRQESTTPAPIDDSIMVVIKTNRLHLKELKAAIAPFEKKVGCEVFVTMMDKGSVKIVLSTRHGNSSLRKVAGSVVAVLSHGATVRIPTSSELQDLASATIAKAPSEARIFIRTTLKAIDSEDELEQPSLLSHFVDLMAPPLLDVAMEEIQSYEPESSEHGRNGFRELGLAAVGLRYAVLGSYSDALDAMELVQHSAYRSQIAQVTAESIAKMGDSFTAIRLAHRVSDSRERTYILASIAIACAELGDAAHAFRAAFDISEQSYFKLLCERLAEYSFDILSLVNRSEIDALAGLLFGDGYVSPDDPLRPAGPADPLRPARPIDPFRGRPADPPFFRIRQIDPLPWMCADQVRRLLRSSDRFGRADYHDMLAQRCGLRLQQIGLNTEAYYTIAQVTNSDLRAQVFVEFIVELARSNAFEEALKYLTIIEEGGNNVMVRTVARLEPSEAFELASVAVGSQFYNQLIDRVILHLAARRRFEQAYELARKHSRPDLVSGIRELEIKREVQELSYAPDLALAHIYSSFPADKVETEIVELAGFYWERRSLVGLEACLRHVVRERSRKTIAVLIEEIRKKDNKKPKSSQDE